VLAAGKDALKWPITSVVVAPKCLSWFKLTRVHELSSHGRATLESADKTFRAAGDCVIIVDFMLADAVHRA
jgi:hypothetical protein